MAVIKAVHSKAKLSVAVDYITKKEKTEERLISGIHCDPMSATLEMESTKKIWHKTGGRQYDHYIQSFAPGENVTPEQAHTIAVRWASGQFFGYECLVSTHVNRDHVHSHIIVNSVNYQTGKKIHTSAHWLQEAKYFSDNLCREAGLTICEKGKTFTNRCNDMEQGQASGFGESGSWRRSLFPFGDRRCGVFCPEICTEP